MTSKRASNSLRADQPRQGKWSKEEEEYVDLLIEEFRCGTLPLREGTTLRSFISQMISCNPKRVSKKYENTNYNGKHKYEPSTVPMSLEETRRRRERLQEYERRFLQALQRSEDELELEEQELRASLEDKGRSVPSVRDMAAAEAEKAAAAEKEGRAMAALLEQQKRKIAASNAAEKRPSYVNADCQDRLTAELQSRMDLANHLSALGGGRRLSTDRSDLALSNSANMTLTLPSVIGSPNASVKPSINSSIGGTPSLNQLASLDLMSSLKHRSSGLTGVGTPMSSLSVPSSRHLGLPTELEDDALGWQVRIQRRTASGQAANPRMAVDRNSFTAASNFNVMAAANKTEAAPFPMPPYLRQQDEALKLPFPSLPEVDHPHLLHSKSAQLQLATLVARQTARRPSLVSEIEMMESLKRGRERQEAMDSLRPFKRLR